MPPLSDLAIRRAKPSSKTQKHFDGGGLYLEISPAGGRWWRLKYRFGGKEKRLALGVYPEVTLALAATVVRTPSTHHTSSPRRCDGRRTSVMPR